MSTPLEIRNAPLGKLFPAIGPFIGAVVFAFFALKGTATGASSGRIALLGCLAAGAAGLGFFMARGLGDQSVQVTLDAKGFRDRRAGDVLVPWSDVLAVRYFAGGEGPRIVHFQLAHAPPDAIKFAPANAANLALPWAKNSVPMDISSLDTTGPAILAAVRRLAPHVKIDG